MNRKPQPSVRDYLLPIYLVLLVATCGSFIYCVLLGQFNGDYFGQPVYSSTGRLLAILGICLLPYFVTWKLAEVIDHFPPRRVFEVHPVALMVFMLVGSAAHIAVTVLYGVGVMDREVYSAPPIISLFIQVLNRLDPFYLGAFFILATPKRSWTDVLAIALMVTIGFLRAGIGVFNYIFIALFAKYSMELMSLARRQPWLVLPGAAALPIIVTNLYEFRNRLRGDIQYEFTLAEMLFGRFMGRLSSFSNVAYIEQHSQSFAWASQSLEPLFYVKQGLVTLLGSGVAPAMTPERLLIAGNLSYEGYSSFMAGIPGNLFMAWHVSPGVAVLNLVVILGTVAAILWLSRYLGSGASRAFGLGMLLYPLTSGVANEFASLLLNTMIFVAFTIVFERRVQRGAVHAG